MVTFLHNLNHVVGDYTTGLLLLSIAAAGLFEWRVKSENKAFMRLSALGTAAAALMVVVMLMTDSLVVPFTLAMPSLKRPDRGAAVRAEVPPPEPARPMPARP